MLIGSGLMLSGITQQRQVAAPSIASQNFSTQAGQRRDNMLPDGSPLVLNTASFVRVTYSGTRRELHLMSGQVLFKVAKDPNRPFDVSARGARVGRPVRSSTWRSFRRAN